MLQIFSQRTHKHRKSIRTTEISQSSGPINLVANEMVYKEWEDRMERDATTASSVVAEQNSGNINRTQSMATLNESFPQGTDSVTASGLLTTVRHNLVLPVQVNAAEGDSINTSIQGFI
ncbi:hypothetical protein Tco_0305105 [Tanacetum coccineum]